MAEATELKALREKGGRKYDIFLIRALEFL